MPSIFSAGSASVNIVPDFSGAQQRIAAWFASQGNLQVRVDPQLDQAAMARLRQQINSASGTAQINVDKDHLAKSLESALAGAIGSLTGLNAVGSALTTGLEQVLKVGIGGALVAVASAASQAAGAVALLPAGFFALAAPVATLVIGMQGVNDAFKIFGATTPAQLQAAQAAMDKLAPSAREFVTQIHTLAPAFDALRLDVQQRLFDGLGGSLTGLGRVALPVLQAGLSGVADSLNNGLLLTVQQLVQDTPQFVTIFANVNDTIARLTAGPLPMLVQDFVQIAAIGSQFLPALATGIGTVVARFTDWLNAAIATGRIVDIIQNAINVISTLASIIGNLGSIVGSISSIAIPFGNQLLDIVNQLTAAVAVFLASPVAQSALATFFQGITIAVQTLIPPILALVQVLVTNFLPVVGQLLAALAPIVGTLLAQFVVVVQAITTVLPPLVQTIAALFSALAPLIPVLGQIIVTLFPPFISLVAQLAPLIGQLADLVGAALLSALAAIAPFLPQIISAFIGILNAIMPLVPVFIQLALQLLPPLLQVVVALAPVLVALAVAFAQMVTAVVQGGLAPVLVAVVNVLSISLVPVLGFLADHIYIVIAALGAWVAIMTLNAIAAAGGLTAALIGLYLRVAMWIVQLPIVTALTGVWGAITTAAGVAMAILTSPITLVILAIGALIAVVVLIITHWQEFKDIVSAIWQWLVSATAATWDWVSARLTEFGNFFVGLWNSIRDFFVNIWNAVFAFVQSVLSSMRDFMVSIFNAVRDFIVTIFTAIFNFYVTIWTTIFNFFVSIGTSILNFFAATWTNLRDSTVAIYTAIRDWLVALWTGLRDAVVSIAQNIWDWLVARWNGLRDATVAIFSAVRDFFAAVWGAIRDNVVAVAQSIWDGVVGIFNKMKQGVIDVFNGITAGVANAWEFIKGIVARPINFVIEYVFNKGLFGIWNWISDHLLGGSLAHLHWDPIPGFASGGRVPGVSPADDSDNIPAMLTADEFVVQRKIAKKTMPFLTALNEGQPEAVQAAGGWFAAGPHLAGGGVVAAQTFAKAQNKKPYIWGGVGPTGYDCSGYQSAITNVLRGKSPYSRVGTTANFPWAGFLNGLGGQYAIGATKDAGGGVGHMAGTLVGVNVEAGGSHGDVAYGERGAAGADAKLFNISGYLPEVGGSFVSGGGASQGSGTSILTSIAGFLGKAWSTITDIFGSFTDAVTGPIGDLVGKFPNMGFLQLPEAMAKGLMSGMWDHIKDAVGSALGSLLGDGVADQSASDGTGTAATTGPIKSQVKSVFDAFWTNPAEWPAADWIIQKESAWNPTAQNPSSTASGLFQFIDGTWRSMRPAAAAAYAHAKDAPVGMQASAGAKYMSTKYGDPIKAQAYWMAHGNYDMGGWLPPGMSTVFNGSGRPEPVLTAAQGDGLARFMGNGQTSRRGGEGNSSPTWHFYLGTREITELVDARLENANAQDSRDLRSAR